MKLVSHCIACSRRRGFTLVEMLISIVVLSILVLLLMGIMNSTSATVGSSWSHLQSDEDGRLVLDRLQLDLQNMLIRSDIDYQFIQNPGSSGAGANDQMAFYATEPGYTAPTSSTSSKRVAAVISYQMAINSTGTNTSNSNQPVLERGANDSFQWNSGATLMAFTASPQLNTTSNTLTALLPSSYDILSTSVFRFELGFLVKNTTTTTGTVTTSPAPPVLLSALPAGTSINNIAAIVVTVATIDSQNAKIIPNSVWPTLVAALPDSTGTTSSSGTSTALAWKNKINSSGFAAAAGIPQKAAAAIRVYDRYFSLNAAP